MATIMNGTDTRGEREPFNPNKHLMQLKSRDGSKEYLPVAFRLVWFREKFPHGTIETDLVHLDLDHEAQEEVTVWEDRKPRKVMKQAKGFAVFRATVKDGLGGIATGTGSEAAVSFGDYIEKAETKAVGRALAAMGFGTQFTGDEFDEGKRIVDSPVPSSNGAQPPEKNGTRPEVPARPVETSQQSLDSMTPATDQQKESIRKICKSMGKPAPDMSSYNFQDAANSIKQLMAEHRSRQARGRVSPLDQRIEQAKQRAKELGIDWNAMLEELKYTEPLTEDDLMVIELYLASKDTQGA